MIETGRLIGFIAAEFGLFLAPGPSVVFVVSAGAGGGRRAGLTAVAGNTLGLITQLAVVVLVLGGVTSDSTGVLEGLKLAGAAWLLQLGVRAIVRRHDRADTAHPEVGPPQTRRRTGRFGQGWVVGITNPKGIVSFSALAPSALHRAHGEISLGVAGLGAAGILVALLCDSAWALSAASARRWLAATGRRQAALDIASGLLMILFGIGLALFTLL